VTVATLKRILRLALVAWLTLTARAEGSDEAEAAANNAPPSLADGAALEDFLDRLFTDALRTHQIPGLAAVVVHGDQTRYLRGHGWADLATETPVDPHATVFPVGSISKLLTTMAVLQLVDQGRLDLDADIRAYLGPDAVDDRFAEPVTLRHILTHTDGFDVRWLFGGATMTPERVPSLARLTQALPRRLVPPGQVYLYSDVGMTAAGRIVEMVAGEDFADYMQNHLLRPLGMEMSSFARPLPAGLQSRRATGYEDSYDGAGTPRPVPTTYPLAGPASGLASTAADLARLIHAQLREDLAAQYLQLSQGSLDTLTRQQFTHHAEIPGTCFGFYEYQYNGQRAVLHGGLMLGFTSVLLLLPEHDLGMMVVINKYGLVSLVEEQFLQRFLDHYFPAPDVPAPALANATEPPAADWRAYEGRYRTDQYSRFSADKLALVSGQGPEIIVEAEPGRLRFRPDGSAWRPIGRHLFECETTGERVVFQTDRRGRVNRIAGSAQFMSYHRLQWFEPLRVQAGLALGFVAATMIGLLVATSTTGHMIWTLSPARPNALHWFLRLLAVLTSLLLLLFLGSFYLGVRHLDVTTAFLGHPPLMQFALHLPRYFVATGALLFGAALAGLRWSDGPRWERWAYVVIGAVALAYVPVLRYWNLLGVPGSL
jgi:CubicO group peptidase (beta-lactamase class C family)